MPPRCIVSSALRPGIEPDLRASKAHVATTRRRELRTSKTTAPAAGIEPATKRLTVALPYQHRTHRNVNGVRRNRATDSKHRLEPRISGHERPCQGRRQPATPPRTQSAQRESNSHFLHGKQMGYHYTMDAKCITTKLSKMPRHQEHRAGIEPASPRYDGGVLPLDHQCQF